MKSQLTAEDVVALLRARNAFLWIVTREEARVEDYLIEACRTAGYLPRTWDVAQGLLTIDGKTEGDGSDKAADTEEPNAALRWIEGRVQPPRDASPYQIEQWSTKSKPTRGVWIMRDLPMWLQGTGGAATARRLRNLARLLPTTERDRAQSIVVLSPSADVPPELAGHAIVIEWPLPDREEVGDILDAALEVQPDEIKATAAPNGTRDAAIDAALGLTGIEAEACYARSLVQYRKIDPVVIAAEKKRVISREKVLEWHEPLAGGLDDVGGLDNLKTWLTGRTAAFSARAREYGLVPPRGCLIVGVPGNGKSMVAKAFATAMRCALLRLDPNALKGKFVGESEANIRKAFRVIEALGKCIVWIDEIEKALQGATSGSSDGGVSADALGSILSWMQERQGAAFVIATANDVSNLPPELMRAGRFDAVWFVDLPTVVERVAVLASALRQNKRVMDPADVQAVATFCDGFSGAELASLVPEAMFTAFADGERAITRQDLLAAAAEVVPLSKTASDKIAKLREWAVGKARPASKVAVVAATKERGGRVLDFAN